MIKFKIVFFCDESFMGIWGFVWEIFGNYVFEVKKNNLLFLL